MNIYTVKWQNLSGHWFESIVPFPSHFVIYDWKCSSHCCQKVQMYDGDDLIKEWSK